jgi:hypothetical protein
MVKKLRMFSFLWLGLALHAAAFATHDIQNVSTLFWKLGNAAYGAFLGYWIDRHSFPEARITTLTPPLWQIRRALIQAAAILAVCLGL